MHGQNRARCSIQPRQNLWPRPKGAPKPWAPEEICNLTFGHRDLSEIESSIVNLLYRYGPLKFEQISDLMHCENVTGTYGSHRDIAFRVRCGVLSLYQNSTLINFSNHDGKWSFNLKSSHRSRLCLGNRIDPEAFYVDPRELYFEEIGVGDEVVYGLYSLHQRVTAIKSGLSRFPIKVGRTKNLKRRILNLSSSGIGMLAVGLVIRTLDSRELEKALHAKLDEHGRRIELAGRREWFRTTPLEIRDLFKGIPLED